MLLLLAITRYTNNCITVHRLHSDYEGLPLRVNKHIVQFHSTVFIIIDISTLDTTSCTAPAEISVLVSVSAVGNNYREIVDVADHNIIRPHCSCLAGQR